MTDGPTQETCNLWPSSKLTLDHGQVYGEYHERVASLMRRMVGRQDAQDLTQQVFSRLIEKGNSFKGRSSLWTWLYSVASNEALNHLRRQQLRDCTPFEEEPAARPDQHETDEAVESALGQLDPTLRVVFVLKEKEGLSYREIAESVGISEGTVGSRLNQARRQLRRYLVQVGVRV